MAQWISYDGTDAGHRHQRPCPRIATGHGTHLLLEAVELASQRDTYRQQALRDRLQARMPDIDGRISKIGDVSVRAALYEAAHIMLTKPLKGCTALKSWAMKVARRSGMTRAKVAPLARRVAVIAHRMLAEDPNAALEKTMQLLTEVRSGVSDKLISVFLVHQISYWDALCGIYHAMQESEDFLPIVITIPFSFNGEMFKGEEEVHAALQELKIPHVRFDFIDHWAGLRILKSLAPNLLFRQSPWDEAIPAPYSVKELEFTRLVYTDYGLNMAQTGKSSDAYDEELHRKAWMLICANEDQRKIYETCAHKGLRSVVTGYPKFDTLLHRGHEEESWPIRQDRRRFRLVWAPHHSVRPEWQGFGTFHLVYNEMLQWAEHNPDIEIVLKPHPWLFGTCAWGLLSKAEVDDFIGTWESLDNTAVQTGGDYAPLLSASDAMLTDGISFLAEYQLFDKPLIWLDSGHHFGFNLIGERIIRGAYRVQTLSEGTTLIDQLRGGVDPLQSQRREVIRYLMPFRGVSSIKVLNAIREVCAHEPPTT